MNKQENEFMVIHKDIKQEKAMRIHSVSSACLDDDCFIVTFMSNEPIDMKVGERFILRMEEVKCLQQSEQ